jgi:hypothetical protein
MLQLSLIVEKIVASEMARKGRRVSSCMMGGVNMQGITVPSWYVTLWFLPIRAITGVQS